MSKLYTLCFILFFSGTFQSEDQQLLIGKTAEQIKQFILNQHGSIGNDRVLDTKDQIKPIIMTCNIGQGKSKKLVTLFLNNTGKCYMYTMLCHNSQLRPETNRFDSDKHFIRTSKGHWESRDKSISVNIAPAHQSGKAASEVIGISIMETNPKSRISPTL